MRAGAPRPPSSGRGCARARASQPPPPSASLTSPAPLLPLLLLPQTVADNLLARPADPMFLGYLTTQGLGVAAKVRAACAFPPACCLPFPLANIRALSNRGRICSNVPPPPTRGAQRHASTNRHQPPPTATHRHSPPLTATHRHPPLTPPPGHVPGGCGGRIPGAGRAAGPRDAPGAGLHRAGNWAVPAHSGRGGGRLQAHARAAGGAVPAGAAGGRAGPGPGCAAAEGRVRWPSAPCCAAQASAAGVFGTCRAGPMAPPRL